MWLMSALPPKADISEHCGQSALCQERKCYDGDRNQLTAGVPPPFERDGARLDPNQLWRQRLDSAGVGSP